jgi:hypothetical protein
MALVPPRFRPYVAALLGLLVTGLGHLYLRRWLRAIAWLALAFGVSIAFVPESTATAVLSGEQVDPLTLLPGLLVGIGSAVDAFRVARQEQRQTDRRAATPDPSGPNQQPETMQPPEPDADAETIDCPACGKPVDPELGFCHWCTTEFETPSTDDE